MEQNFMEIEKEIELLKIAISHVNVAVFKYDFNSSEITFLKSTETPFGLPHTIKDGVNYIINQGIFDKDDSIKLNHLFNLMQQGEKSAGDILKLQSAQNIYCHFLFTNCFDEECHPIYAVGTIQDVTDQVTSELHYTKEEQFRLAMLADHRRVYEINVTKDRFMKLERIQNSTDYDDWTAYTTAMDYLRRTKVCREDWEVFSEVAERDNLLYSFANGKTEFYCEYRYIADNGKIIWSSSTTHLLRDPITNDIKGFIYVKDIDTQKKQEILLYQRAEQDGLTGLYNRGTAKLKIEKVLGSSEKGQLHGFMAIDVDDFKMVNDTFGHLKGDYLLQEIAKGFKKIVRNEDIVARMGGDEFIVFLNDVISVSHVENAAQRLREYVEEIELEKGNEYRSSISIGIAVFPGNGFTFEELYKNSDSSLYRSKHNGKNCVTVFSNKNK